MPRKPAEGEKKPKRPRRSGKPTGRPKGTTGIRQNTGRAPSNGDLERAEAALHRAGRYTTLTSEVIDALEALIMRGNYIETSCSVVGVPRSTFIKWMATGRKAREALEAGSLPEGNEDTWRMALELSERIVAASAKAEAVDLNKIDSASVGGHEQVTTVTRTFPVLLKSGEPVLDEHGNTLMATETSVTKSTTPPQWTAAAWKLERTRPHRYGKQSTIEHVGDPDRPMQSETKDTSKPALDLSKLSTDELLTLYELQRKAASTASTDPATPAPE